LDLLEKTREEWARQIESINQEEDIVLPTNYERIVDWAEKTVKSEDEIFARPHGVTSDLNGGPEYAKALLKITYAHNRKPAYVKLLEIHLEPELDLDGREQIEFSDRKEARRVVSNALLNSLELIFTDLPSSKLKVYGRTEQMKSFFDLTIDTLEEEGSLPDGLDIEREGSWLVFDKS
jgi:hypothetical protein